MGKVGADSPDWPLGVRMWGIFLTAFWGKDVFEFSWQALWSKGGDDLPWQAPWGKVGVNVPDRHLGVRLNL